MIDMCFGCFEKREGDKKCPHCGFIHDELERSGYLPLGYILAQRYIIGKVLGNGGFGNTYLAYDKVLDVKMAIKEYMPRALAVREGVTVTIIPKSQSDKENYIHHMKRFMDEAKVIARFSNEPGIVSIQDVIEANGSVYIVMYYVDGNTLTSYVKDRQGRLGVDDTINIMTVVINSLQQVHKKGLIHRDISPDNIYITGEGDVKLLDFGAARYVVSDEAEGMTVILKPGFAPPEQYKEQGVQGTWTDVYAIAATMYWMLTGIKPQNSYERYMHDNLKSVEELGLDVPLNISKTIFEGLILDEKNRIRTLGDFYKGLMTPISEEDMEETLLLSHTVLNTKQKNLNGVESMDSIENPIKKEEQIDKSKSKSKSKSKIKRFWLPLVGLLSLVIVAGVYLILSRDENAGVNTNNSETENIIDEENESKKDGNKSLADLFSDKAEADMESTPSEDKSDETITGPEEEKDDIKDMDEKTEAKDVSQVTVSVDVEDFDLSKVTTSASSVFEESIDGNLVRYNPNLVLDGSNNTSWVEGAPGNGIGEWIEFEVNRKGSIDSVSIVNGFASNEEYYYKNNRIKKIEIVTDDGSYEVDLLDNTLEFQTITFQSPIITGRIKFTILEIYKGSTFEDTCIAEIKINNQGAIELSSNETLNLNEFEPVEEDYFLGESHIRYLTESEILKFSLTEIKFARNEIFARHGYQFKMEIFQNYFSNKPWYSSNPDFKAQDLNSFESYNINLLKEREVVLEEDLQKTGWIDAIIPNINVLYLSEDHISGLDQWWIKLARYEIYARHGASFEDKEIQDYFLSKSWYKINPDFDENELNIYEQVNASFLLD